MLSRYIFFSKFKSRNFVRSSTNPIEPPYFVITKNQRRHQAYSCTFCKGKTTFITIVQALRHLKANHRHNVRYKNYVFFVTVFLYFIEIVLFLTANYIWRWKISTGNKRDNIYERYQGSNGQKFRLFICE